MKWFQASCLASAVGGGLGGSISGYSDGVAWMFGGFFLGGCLGVISFFLITAGCSFLVSSTGTNQAPQDELNGFQQAVLGITLGLTMVAPVLALAGAIGGVTLLREAFS